MLRYISIYWTLLPILTGLFFIRKLAFEYRLVLCLLIYGFFTDMIVGNARVSEPLRYFLFNFFHLFESIMLTWVLIYLGKTERLKMIGKFLLFFFPVFWLITHSELLSPGSDIKKISPLFSASYNMILAVLFGFLTIKFAEKTVELFSNSMFWFLLAIFLNCFCVFFIFSLLTTSFIREIWFVQSSLNILVYTMFTTAFILEAKRQGSTLQIKQE